MAQVSPNTSTYDSAVYKISNFFDRYYNNEFKTHEDFINEYQKLLGEVECAASGVITQYNPLVRRTGSDLKSNIKILSRYYSGFRHSFQADRLPSC